MQRGAACSLLDVLAAISVSAPAYRTSSSTRSPIANGSNRRRRASRLDGHRHHLRKMQRGAACSLLDVLAAISVSAPAYRTSSSTRSPIATHRQRRAS
jgi:hypothetical protein